MFLLGLCFHDSQLADDIAQEALMKAYIASSDYKPWHKFSSWLLKIAYNTYLDHQKLYHVKNRSPLDGVQDKEFNSTTEDTFEYQELYKALGELNEKERTSIMLFYIYGYSVREISRITGDSMVAVKKQLSRARAHLKDKLSESCK